MITIAAPRYADDSADKNLDCEFAMEPAFRELAGRAADEGWSEDDVASALMSLSHHHLRGIIEDRKTQSAIRHEGASLVAGPQHTRT